MSLGQTTSAPASTCETAVRAISSSDASLSTSPSREHAAVAVRRVLAEAHVGEQQQLGEPRPQRAQRLLHDAVLDPRARALVVLLLRDPEQDHRARRRARTSSSHSRTTPSTVCRGSAGSRSFGSASGATKSGMHEVVERDGRLAHEVAQRAGAAQPAQAGDGKRAHAEGYRRTADGHCGRSTAARRLDLDRDRRLPGHGSSVSRSAKNSQIARPTASSGSAISAPARP